MSRFRGLDGLRGLAALAVVFSHALMTDPQFSRSAVGLPVDGWRQVLTYSPLHLIWAGTEAVDVFFVLSGFVLVLPALRDSSGSRWLGYFPQRIVRLTLPIWAAVAFAAALAAAVPRSPHAASPWVAQHADALTLGNVRQGLEVVRGANGLNTALWSMQWEMLFSLLLPLFVLAALGTRRGWHLGAILAAAVSAYGVHIDSTGLQFLAMFAVGSCLAAGRAYWQPWLAGLSGRQQSLLAGIALLLVNARWTSLAVATSASALPWCTGLTLIGAAGLVCLFAAAAPIASLGTWGPVAGLGTISFSLYLVHEPIVVSLAQLDRARVPWLAVAALAVPVSLVVAVVFHRWIEAPAHRLSRRVGSRARALSRPARSGN